MSSNSPLENVSLKGMPEIFETELDESLKARNFALANGFMELGPYDLVHIIKTSSGSSILATSGPSSSASSTPSLQRSQSTNLSASNSSNIFTGSGSHNQNNYLPHSKEIGSYHYAAGVDCSSSASIAAYLNSLTYSLDEPSGGWVDVRVEARIPGGVKAYVVHPNGQRSVTTPEIWSETQVSSIIRAIHDSFNPSSAFPHHPCSTFSPMPFSPLQYRPSPLVKGIRRLSPLMNPVVESKFLEACKVPSLILRAPMLLGCSSTIQTPTLVNNWLVEGLMKYYCEGVCRPGVAALFFEDVAKLHKEPVFLAPAASCWFQAAEQVKALEILEEGLKQVPLPLSTPHLLTQARFLSTKKNYDDAKKLVILAVEYSPTEFMCWALLVEIYILLEDYEKALITLNSCPMYSILEKDMVKMPTPLRVRLPIKFESSPHNTSSNTGNNSNSATNHHNIYASLDSVIERELYSLQTPHLSGTFAISYHLLSWICKKMGWDDLLRMRSNTFIMEEEYRRETNPKLASSKSKEDLTLTLKMDKDMDEMKEKETTLKKVSAYHQPMLKKEVKTSALANQLTETNQEIIVAALDDISISQKEKSGITSGQPIKSPRDSDHVPPPGIQSNNTESKVNRERKPEFAAAIDQLEEDNLDKRKDNEEAEQDNVLTPSDTNLDKKRLCERWLDNLFLLLYEDLRISMIWKAEAHHLEERQLSYQRSPLEWEILGDLGRRLNYIGDAKEAYLKVVEARPSAKAYLALMECYVNEGKVFHALTMFSKYLEFEDAYYRPLVTPSSASALFFKLLSIHGLQKVQSAIFSLNLPPKSSVKLIIQQLEDWCQQSKAQGTDY